MRAAPAPRLSRGPAKDRDETGTGIAPARKRRRAPAFGREQHDHYVEERWVSARLFALQPLGPVIVDPCAGFGNIVLSARAAGLRAYGCDLVSRTPLIGGGRDFFAPGWRAPERAGRKFDIAGNPPFARRGRSDLIREFALCALERATRVALLAPTARLNAARWLEGLPLAHIIFCQRSSLWPGPIYAARQAAGERLGQGKTDVAWLVFDPAAPPGVRLSWVQRNG